MLFRSGLSGRLEPACSAGLYFFYLLPYIATSDARTCQIQCCGAQGGAQAGPDMNGGQQGGAQDNNKHGDNVQDADFEEVK